MKAVIIAALLYAAYKAIQRARERQEAERQRREEVQRQTDAARMREEWRRTQEQAKEAIHRQEELYREQERQRRGQEQIRREQERQHREQIRQAEQLAALNFRISQAEADIAAGEERIASLYALMDIAAAAQHKAEPGSKQDEQAQRKIISLQNQIHTTEKRIAKAQFDRETAQRKQAG